MSELRSQLLQWIAADEERMVGFLADFVRARSPNPPGDTREAVGVVTRLLASEGLAHELVAPQPQMPNVVAEFAGARPGRHVVFNGHIDVFPVNNEAAWERAPWSGEVEGGRMYGRGVADMKAGTTASIFAYIYLSRLRDRLPGRVTLTAVSDEETGGTWGSRFLLDTMPERVLGDCVINGEPGGVGTIRFGEKGILQFKVAVRTRGAHGPYPNLSKSAIRIAGDIMRDLDALTAWKPDLPAAIAGRLAAPATRAVIESTMGAGTAELMTALTVNIGVVHGGTKVNMIAADCDFEVDIRMPIGIDRGAVLAEAERIVGRYPEATMSDIVGTPSNYCDPEHEMVAIMRRNVAAVGRPDPALIPSLGGSDGRMWRERGVPAYIYGPTPANISAPNESIAIADFLDVVRVHALSALDYLTAGEPA
ncbi:MAG: M20/M25/M40 family metallo-hydrolase [Alphaproteobacteria bacterium]|nr:M20/M25/M40 family metallo-hydrolase [Alphaproteobacteria bacterium]